MLYHIKGLNPPDDPYQLEGFEVLDRQEVKRVVMSFFNCTNKRQFATLLYQSSEHRFEEPYEVMSVLETHFNELEEYFYVGMAGALQSKDSFIAVDVVSRMMAQGIVCLPIHDSFIVKERHEAELYTAMHAAYAGYGDAIITRA